MVKSLWEIYKRLTGKDGTALLDLMRDGNSTMKKGVVRIYYLMECSELAMQDEKIFIAANNNDGKKRCTSHSLSLSELEDIQSGRPAKQTGCW